MKVISNLTFLFFIIANLISCSTAQQIQSIRIPVAPYLKMSCKELATEQGTLIREAEAALWLIQHTPQIRPRFLSHGFYLHQLLFLYRQAEAAKLAGEEAVSEAQRTSVFNNLLI